MCQMVNIRSRRIHVHNFMCCVTVKLLISALATIYFRRVLGPGYYWRQAVIRGNKLIRSFMVFHCCSVRSCIAGHCLGWLSSIVVINTFYLMAAILDRREQIHWGNGWKWNKDSSWRSWITSFVCDPWWNDRNDITWLSGVCHLTLIMHWHLASNLSTAWTSHNRKDFLKQGKISVLSVDITTIINKW